MRLSYAIIFVSDMQRAIAFYRDVIGLPLKFESPHWTEFATEGATIALHQSDAEGSRENPLEVPSGRCRPGISVPDLEAFHARMESLKVPCVQLPKDVFGARIAQYLDPDGLGISVSQERKR
jgi:lactoylglutathione lyase